LLAVAEPMTRAVGMTDEAGRLSEDQRRAARAMAGLGVSRHQIAKYLGLEEAVLAAMLGDELDQAEVDANAKVAKSLFTMATQKNNVAAAIFWMKARGGWREKQEVEVTAAASPRFVVHAPEPMTVEEWTEKYVPKDLA
jgi:2-hydroxychromene-2-carboxylate isomerase